MLSTPVIARAWVEFYEITQLAVIIIPTFLFAVYKLISRCQRHRVKKLKIEKGIVSARSKSRGGAKWIRSIYTAIFLMLASGPLGVYLVKYQNGLDNIGPFILCIVLPFCAGIAFLIRGLLRRKHYLRKLALNNGVAFEVICPPQKQWILPMAIGLPLLIYAGAIIALTIIMGPSGYTIIDMSIIPAGILGVMFFLYGVLMCIVIGRNKARAVVVQNKVEPSSFPSVAEQPGDTQMI